MKVIPKVLFPVQGFWGRTGRLVLWYHNCFAVIFSTLLCQISAVTVRIGSALSPAATVCKRRLAAFTSKLNFEQ